MESNQCMVMVFVVIFQGDEADCMYFVEEGEVSIMIKQQVINRLILFVLYLPSMFRLCSLTLPSNHIVLLDLIMLPSRLRRRRILR